jgi:PAS domain S-box-containing protein
MFGGGPDATRLQVEELDLRRRLRNTRALSLGMTLMSLLLVPAMLIAGLDVRVVLVTLIAALAFGACAWASCKSGGPRAAIAFNVLLAAALFAGVAANGQIGEGPALVAFSLFVAVATLPVQGVVAAGIAGALNVAAMCWVARDVPQLAETYAIALTYGLALCVVTTLMGLVAMANMRRAFVKVVEREQRAAAGEARASESEALYRLITEGRSDLVALLDEDGRFVYASPSFGRFLGLQPDDLLRTSRFDLAREDDRGAVLADFAEALSRGRARGTYRSRDKAGRERWVEWVYDAVTGPSRTLVAVAARDVTEQRLLASQLQRAHKMDALGRMAAGVAHDFNNLLMVAGAAISMTRRELPESSMGWRLLGEGEQATSAAAALTARLLAFSRQAPITTQVVDARQALDGLADLLARALGPEIALKVDLRGDLPPVVAAPIQLEQILLNLAINARDAMPAGGALAITARGRQIADAEELECGPGSWLELTVTDTGSGMSDEILARIFEPFFTTKLGGQGTGLGLSTCYGIVRQLGGSIRVTSEVGSGTTFRILLPRATGPLMTEAHIESA